MFACTFAQTRCHTRPWDMICPGHVGMLSQGAKWWQGLGARPTTYASMGEGAGAWQVARASLDGMGDSFHTLGQWCGGDSGSVGAGPEWHSGQRGRGTGSGLLLQWSPALLSPRTPHGGSWPLSWSWGLVGSERLPSWGPPEPQARQAYAIVFSRGLQWPRQQKEPGQEVLRCRSAG